MCALSEEEYIKVHAHKDTKDMWDTLDVTYEGCSEVTRNRLSLLTKHFELFTMIDVGSPISICFLYPSNTLSS